MRCGRGTSTLLSLMLVLFCLQPAAARWQAFACFDGLSCAPDLFCCSPSLLPPVLLPLPSCSHLQFCSPSFALFM